MQKDIEKMKVSAKKVVEESSMNKTSAEELCDAVKVLLCVCV